MKYRTKSSLFALLLGLSFVAVWLAARWSVREPTQGGKTVTEWLDTMALVDTTRYDTNNGEYRVGFPPETVANDPALRALLQIGSQGVPVLVKRIAEPPEPEEKDLWVRLRGWFQHKWWEIRNPKWIAPWHFYSRKQMARKLAAAFTLLALGTNANGGYGRLLEAYAAPPAPYLPERDFRGGIFLEHAVMMAKNNLPERKQEIMAGIIAGLHHAKAACREGAAMSAGNIYVEERLVWKDRLIQLAQDSDLDVRYAALSALLSTARLDVDIRRLAERVLQDRTNPTRLRACAARGLMHTWPTSVSLLREVLRKGDPELQRELRWTIQQIEGDH